MEIDIDFDECLEECLERYGNDPNMYVICSVKCSEETTPLRKQEPRALSRRFVESPTMPIPTP